MTWAQSQDDSAVRAEGPNEADGILRSLDADLCRRLSDMSRLDDSQRIDLYREALERLRSSLDGDSER